MTHAEANAAYMEFLKSESTVVHLVFQEMKRGKKCAAAIDHVCGDGSFEKLAEEIWRRCRAA